MTKTTKDMSPTARLPKGFLDSEGADLRAAKVGKGKKGKGKAKRKAG